MAVQPKTCNSDTCKGALQNHAARKVPGDPVLHWFCTVCGKDNGH